MALTLQVDATSCNISQDCRSASGIDTLSIHTMACRFLRDGAVSRGTGGRPIYITPLIESEGDRTAASSTSTFTNKRLVFFRLRPSKTGAIILHGPHHAAVKSTTTYEVSSASLSL